MILSLLHGGFVNERALLDTAFETITNFQSLYGRHQFFGERVVTLSWTYTLFAQTHVCGVPKILK